MRRAPIILAACASMACGSESKRVYNELQSCMNSPPRDWSGDACDVQGGDGLDQMAFMRAAAEEAGASEVRWGTVSGKRLNFDGEGGSTTGGSGWHLEVCWGGPLSPRRLRREVPGSFMGPCMDDLACADPAVDCSAWHELGEMPRVSSIEAIRTVFPGLETGLFDVDYDFEERMWIVSHHPSSDTVHVNADTGEIVR